MTNFDVMVADALKSEDVSSLLGDGTDGVYNAFCDWKGKFPLIIFQKASKAPVLHADNKLYGYSVSYKIVVANQYEEADNVVNAVINAMENAGFMWASSDTEYNDEFHEFYTIMMFRIGEKKES